MNAVILAPAGHPDAPEGWPISNRPLQFEGDLRPGELNFTDDELAAHVASMRQTYDAWRSAIVEPYLITDFFDRLSMDEWSTIQEVKKTNPQIAYFWDKLMTLREGIEGPPDGATPGRAMAAAAKAACAEIFGQERADQLFAK